MYKKDPDQKRYEKDPDQKRYSCGHIVLQVIVATSCCTSMWPRRYWSQHISFHVNSSFCKNVSMQKPSVANLEFSFKLFALRP